MSIHVLLAVVLALVLAACAMDRPGAATLDPDAPTDSSDDPVPQPPADGPVLLAGESEVDDLPPISVAEALEAEHGQTVVVTGALFVDADGTVRLCDAIAESFPPQCAGDRIVVEGVDLEDVPGLQTEGEVSWAETAEIIGSIQH